MQLTLNIDVSNTKAMALLNYIKTLDFVSFDNNYILSEAEKQAVNVGIASLERGEKLKHKDVMDNMKKLYPNLF